MEKPIFFFYTILITIFLLSWISGMAAITYDWEPMEDICIGVVISTGAILLISLISLGAYKIYIDVFGSKK